jgi:hypothetical protein
MEATNLVLPRMAGQVRRAPPSYQAEGARGETIRAPSDCLRERTEHASSADKRDQFTTGGSGGQPFAV